MVLTSLLFAPKNVIVAISVCMNLALYLGIFWSCIICLVVEQIFPFDES